MMEVYIDTAVIFDLGGVIFGSPLQALINYEKKINIPQGTFNRAIKNNGTHGAFSLFESSLITYEEFCKQFEEEVKQELNGVESKFKGEDFVNEIEKETQNIRKKLIEFIKEIKKENVKVAVITNNWYSPFSNSEEYKKHWNEFQNLFDVFVESRVVKIRKPDKRIYELTLKKLKVENPQNVVFLDDIGRNLKNASSLGIKTILVKNEEQAIEELKKILKKNFSKL
eukprot:gene7677-12143_t